MRLISQDGNGDMPYENFIFRVHGGDIVASRDVFTNEKQIVARYSTEAKAKRAMEMLRGAYCGELYMKCGDYKIEDIDLSQDFEKKIREEMSKPHFLEIKPNNPVIECKIFQFPADDELEG